MLTIPVFNRAGEQVGEEQIDPAHFGGEVNKQLLHDVVVMHEANRRVGTVNTRGRSDVAGSTRKMYRQKGTGNARMGAKRTNKRVGGGMAFAKRNRDYSYAMPKKAVRQATRMALLSKFQDGQALIIEDIGPFGPDATPRTKEVVAVLRALPRPDLAEGDATPTDGETRSTARDRTVSSRSVLIGLPEHDTTFYLSARNIEGVQVAPVAEFNTYDILKQRYLLLTRAALDALKARASEPVDRRVAPAPAAAGSEA